MHADIHHAWCCVSVHNPRHAVINLDTRQCRKLNHSLTLCSRAAIKFADMYLSGGTVKAGRHKPAAASRRRAPTPYSGTCALMPESASLRRANCRPWPLDNWEARGMLMDAPLWGVMRRRGTAACMMLAMTWWATCTFAQSYQSTAGKKRGFAERGVGLIGVIMCVNQQLSSQFQTKEQTHQGLPSRPDYIMQHTYKHL